MKALALLVDWICPHILPFPVLLEPPPPKLMELAMLPNPAPTSVVAPPADELRSISGYPYTSPFLVSRDLKSLLDVPGRSEYLVSICISDIVG